MVVLQRSEVQRHRVLFILALILSVTAIVNMLFNLIPAIVVGSLAVVTLMFSLYAIYGYPKRSQVLVFQTDEVMVLATNALHEGFKLRFLRDIFGDNMTSLSDEDRAHWKPLEADGFYATLRVQNVRKLILVRLCTMIFDDVFVADPSNRWEHHDSASTAEPTFSKREMPRLTGWKSST